MMAVGNGKITVGTLSFLWCLFRGRPHRPHHLRFFFLHVKARLHDPRGSAVELLPHMSPTIKFVRRINFASLAVSKSRIHSDYGLSALEVA